MLPTTIIAHESSPTVSLFVFPVVSVLGIPIQVVERRRFMAFIDKLEAYRGRCLCISATSMHGIIHACRNLNYAQVLHKFTYNLPDGKPVAWLGSREGAGVHQYRGIDLIQEVVTRTKKQNLRHFFCGGKQGTSQQMMELASQKWKNPHAVGCFELPFSSVEDYDYPAIARVITEARADILWIGISTPKQEYFAQRLVPYLRVAAIFTVGAAFDFHTNKLCKPPKIFITMGLEWLYRLYLEPRRLWRRYIGLLFFTLYYTIKNSFILKKSK